MLAPGEEERNLVGAGLAEEVGGEDAGASPILLGSDFPPQALHPHEGVMRHNQKPCPS